MHLYSVWDPDKRRAVLCVEGDGGRLLVVGDGRFADVAELVAHGTGGSIEDAVHRAGTDSQRLGLLEQLAAAEPAPTRMHLLPPVLPIEVWAAGVTYERSRDARMHESADADAYERVYHAERPELFFKGTGARVVGPGGRIGLRHDAAWRVPEPELALLVGREGRIVGYTLGNDVSSRDIEGENTLYLPQAKIFAGSSALGPAVVTLEEIPDPTALTLALRILRDGRTLFEGSSSTSRLHVQLETLVRYLALDNWLPPLTVLLTGTGIVPPDDVSLEPGDAVEIHCDAIGTLRNLCAPAAALAPPEGWWRPE